MSTLAQLKKTIDKMITEGGKDWEDVPVAYALWTAPDVVSIAEGEDITLTDGEIAEVLDEVYHSQDCEYGINWESIRQAVLNQMDFRIIEAGAVNEKDN